MLPREIMGLLCLGVVWVTALLVAGAAWHDWRDLHTLALRARRMCIEAVVVRGDGDDGAFAEWSVEQTGWAQDGDRAEMEFHDRMFRSAIFGGVINLDGGGSTYSVTRSDGDVWVSEAARVAAAACDDIASFDEAYAQARKAKGYRRDVRVRVRTGDKVFVVGKVDEGSGALVAPPDAPLLVSTIDPRAFCAHKSWLIALFVPAELLACAMATRIASSTPHFGTTSIVGAILCLAFFLGVTPLAVALRESVRVPRIAYLRGSWTRRALMADAKSPAPAQV